MCDDCIAACVPGTPPAEYCYVDADYDDGQYCAPMGVLYSDGGDPAEPQLLQPMANARIYRKRNALLMNSALQARSANNSRSHHAIALMGKTAIALNLLTN